jgi:IclR family transcriptional regulator, acetate operon repressor
MALKADRVSGPNAAEAADCPADPAPVTDLADDDQGRRQTVAAIERAADVILYFTTVDRPDSGITEIARDLGMAKAAVHRVLASLRSRDLISLDETTRRYSLGPAVLSLGLTYLDRLDVCGLAAAALPGLSRATNETATLSVRTGNSRVYVEQVTPPREVIMSVRIGVPYPLHAGASSKAFLAFMRDEEIDAYFRTAIEPLTSATIVDEDELREQLAQIRDRGWAESVGERQAGAASVAAPVLNHTGAPSAVLSISGPADRFVEIRSQATKILLETTQRLSAQLGYVAG